MYFPVILNLLMLDKQGRNRFQSTSASRKAIRDTSGALKWLPLPVPLPLNFSEETDKNS